MIRAFGWEPALRPYTRQTLAAQRRDVEQRDDGDANGGVNIPCAHGGLLLRCVPIAIR